jgi:hypothetical protein
VHGLRRRKTLTGSATAKLTSAEENLVREAAAAAGLTKSEWCRQVLLQAIHTGPETRLVLSELLALRVILLRLHLDLIEGQEPTKERLSELFSQADATKYSLADKRILAFRSEPVSGAARGNGMEAGQ